MQNEQEDPRSVFWLWCGRIAVITAVLLFGVRAALADTGLGNFLETLIGLAFGAITVTIALLLIRLGGRVIKSISGAAWSCIGAALAAVMVLDSFSPTLIARSLLDSDAWGWPFEAAGPLGLAATLTFVLALSFVIGLALIVRDGGLKNVGLRTRIAMVVTTAILTLAATGNVLHLIDDGEDPFPTEFESFSGELPQQISAPDPSAMGTGSYTLLSYGAGANKRRPEFGDQRDLESRTVDASSLLPEWKGIKKRMREWYWGFGLEEAPLNGLAWIPEGRGPFPLALIVHGNHGMEEYSDPGYAYLGELLASRGIITVSVDENYINGTWSGDFQGKEMPARAWLLLEHLRLWRDWNSTAGHRFEGRVDMDSIALLGHSRGGEAAAIAYAYNDLPYFPDDATVSFDYGFSIQSIVAIAQIDQRYHRRVKLKDVNFLTLQGSYDSDESAFHGLRQFNRIELDREPYRFKAGLYIHGANHGQFNSIWGREDSGPPGSWQLNLAPLIAGEDQRKIAAVYTSAFLQATLKGDMRYLPLFRNPRSAASWLPGGAYVQQFTDSTFIPLANFDEDLDVHTGTADGASIAASGFSLWREEELRHRDEMLQGTSAVVLGWDEDARPELRINVPQDYWPENAGDDYVLSLSVSASTEEPKKGDEAEDADNAAVDKATGPPLFEILAQDTSGNIGTVVSSEQAHLAPPLKVRFLKHVALNKSRYKADWEPILQHFEIPLATLLSRPDAVVGQLIIRFDSEEAGTVIIDNVGLQRR